MTHYHKKLAALQKKRQKLIEAEKTLIEKRKKEISNLAEQFNLLTVEDKILSNFFAYFKEYYHEPPPKTSHTSRIDSPHQPAIHEA